ncbi:MAG: hypothetical protein AAB036_04570 [Elusimicrobiota bacterium]
MKTTTRRWLASLVLLIGLGWAGKASAAPVFVSSDSLTITITPNAQYRIDIDTFNSSLDLGFVDLDQDTFTVKPATVTVGSTFATTDIRVVTQIAGGWTLDPDTSNKEQNALQAWGVFTDTSIAASPGGAGAFSGTSFGANNSDVLGDSVGYAGTAGGVTQYVLTSAEAGYKSMDAIPSYATDEPASKAYLWLKFHLPPATTVTNAQEVTITLGGAAPLP